LEGLSQGAQGSYIIIEVPSFTLLVDRPYYSLRFIKFRLCQLSTRCSPVTSNPQSPAFFSLGSSSFYMALIPVRFTYGKQSPSLQAVQYICFHWHRSKEFFGGNPHKFAMGVHLGTWLTSAAPPIPLNTARSPDREGRSRAERLNHSTPEAPPICESSANHECSLAPTPPLRMVYRLFLRCFPARRSMSY